VLPDRTEGISESVPRKGTARSQPVDKRKRPDETGSPSRFFKMSLRTLEATSTTEATTTAAAIIVVIIVQEAVVRRLRLVPVESGSVRLRDNNA
jgi:hypothetical protein